MALMFNMNDLNPGKWFSFGGDARVCLRVAPQSAIRSITKRSERKGKVDPETFDRLLWDYCIVDWEQILEPDGIPIECTEETKATLMGGAPDFAQFVTERLAEIREAKLTDEELEKN